MRNPIIQTYDNGLRLVYDSPPIHAGKTIIRVFVHVGSAAEPDSIRGASHFIEHMCFKGTKNRHTGLEISEPFSHFGAYFNATTTKQYTCYKVDCLDSHFGELLSIVSDMIFNSTFNREEYKKEMKVIVEESKLKPPNSYVENLAFAGTPYEHWVDHKSFHKLGATMPYDEVLQFYKTHYKPHNMVLSIVSDTSFDKIRRAVSRSFFGSAHSDIRPLLNPPNSGLTQQKSALFLKASESMTSNVELAVRVCGLFNDDDYCALDVLRQIVGGSTSSRLFVELREKRGLTYNSRVYLEFYEPAGIFVICAKSDSDKLVKDGNSPGVLPTILSLVDDLIKRGVSNAEIKWAKTRIKEMGIMNKDQVVDQCEYNGERVMLNNDTGIVPHDQIYERRYASITKSTVDAVIRKYFSPRVYFLSIMGGRVPRRSVIEKLM